MPTLVLTRRPGEAIFVGDAKITVEAGGSQTRLSIEAPPEIRVDREEVRQAKDAARLPWHPCKITAGRMDLACKAGEIYSHLLAAGRCLSVVPRCVFRLDGMSAVEEALAQAPARLRALAEEIEAMLDSTACTRNDPEWDDDCGCPACVEERVYREDARP